jgi:hypothetical protein
MLNRKVIGIVTQSTDPYVPLNEKCVIWINKKYEVYGVHRISDGAGTYLFSSHDRKNTFYKITD